MPEPSAEKATYQQYVDAKAELNELMTRKKIVDKNLAGLENSIYAFEGSYLEDTLHGGNIIRGFDGYVSTKPEKSRLKYSDSDRLFSMSSTTFTKALAIKENPEQESSQDESKRSSSVGNYKRPPKTSNSISSSASTSAAAGSSSSNSRRLVKQPKPGKSSSDRPPKKMRLSSTGRDDGDEDLDV
ncbi:chromatin modification-related protein EAF6 [Entomortierella parvispora]|uniref:Chromatin modification-related protein EAF6 n=1 Tax=Entomortierella parvispora TaxID=205924 RepID=A0A9P3LUQ2_9FUNG|nr:chromatin modification-related protein EAF6 [Entomortierella parvispora]